MTSIPKKARIATRGSKLALWQANYVADLLKQEGVDTELQIIKTTGDRVQDRFLHEIGGKGLFVRELEKSMEDGNTDLAVHSLKDLPAKIPANFRLGAVLKRHRPNDAIIFTQEKLAQLKLPNRPLHAEDFKSMGEMTIATSSLRRQSLFKTLKSPIHLVPVRGNVDTRIEKLKLENWDALILASASLERLGMTDLPYRLIDTDWYVPCAAQGALAIECPENSPFLEVLRKLNDPETEKSVQIERLILERLGGDCTMPFGAFLESRQGSAETKVHALVLDYQGNEARYVLTIPMSLADVRVEDVVNSTLQGLMENGLKAILNALKLNLPDLGVLSH